MAERNVWKHFQCCRGEEKVFLSEQKGFLRRDNLSFKEALGIIMS